MSDRLNRQPRVLMIPMPKWLSWRAAGLMFVVAILTFILAAMWVGRSNGAKGAPSMYARLKNLSRLTTIEMKLSTAVKITNARTLIRGVNEVMVYGICGRVTAGIDLSELEKTDVDEDIGKRRIRLRVPPAVIFSVTRTYDNDFRDVPRYQLAGKKRWVEMRSACEYEYDWYFDPPIPVLEKTPELIILAREEGVKAFAETAEESGIREMAQVEAEKQLERLLRLTGYETIEIEIKQGIQPHQELP